MFGIQFFDEFDFLSKVFRVWVVIEVFVCCLAEPIVSSLQLIGEVSVIVFLLFLFDELIGVCGLTSQGEHSSCMLICWFYILILAMVSWELRTIRTKLRTRPITME